MTEYLQNKWPSPSASAVLNRTLLGLEKGCLEDHAKKRKYYVLACFSLISFITEE